MQKHQKPGNRDVSISGARVARSLKVSPSTALFAMCWHFLFQFLVQGWLSEYLMPLKRQGHWTRRVDSTSCRGLLLFFRKETSNVASFDSFFVLLI